jgi:phage terminase small subunit
VATRQPTKPKGRGKPQPSRKPDKAANVHNGLNIQRATFAREYATNGGNGEKAAIAAGYSEKTARQKAVAILKDPAVVAEIRKITEAGAKRAEITVERIMEELAVGAFADITDFVEWDSKGVRLKASSQLDTLKRRGIVEVSETMNGVKIKLMNKLSALELAGKQIGMFKHQLELPNDPETGQPLGLILVPMKQQPPAAAPAQPPGDDDPADGD